jgi:hypothetical protein
MVGACVTVAQSSDYQPVWNGKPPADFGTDKCLLRDDPPATLERYAEMKL